MTVSYNITGTERKSLVGAISTATNSPTKYLGAPTFAYKVGNYHIDKNGTVTGNDNELLVAELAAQGFTAAEVVYENTYNEVDERIGSGNWMGEPADDEDALDTAIETALETRADDVEIDAAIEAALEAAPDGNDVPEYYTYRAELYDPDSPDRMEIFSASDDADALRQAREYCTGEVTLLELHLLDDDYEFVRGVDIPTTLTVEMPLTGFTPEKLDNLAKLVTSKTLLLKAALGADDLPIEMTADTLRFPWFGGDLSAEAVNAYTTLIAKLCATAKEKQRVTAKEKEVENPKFAFRCFLLSLGFIGNEYKAARKILLRNLDGNSSFKSGARKAEVAE